MVCILLKSINQRVAENRGLSPIISRLFPDYFPIILWSVPDCSAIIHHIMPEMATRIPPFACLPGQKSPSTISFARPSFEVLAKLFFAAQKIQDIVHLIEIGTK